MRTVIFILAMNVKDLAVAKDGKEFEKSDIVFLGILFYTFLAMDIIDFIESI